jgi:N-acyl-L-homoserine lactone synthetase
MIHVVTDANRADYQAQIDEMHRLRWNYYIGDRNWRELRELQSQEGYERDCYDDQRAVYLLSLDAGARLNGAIRMRRTDRPTLLTDRYWHLVDDPGALALGPDVWEITRVIRTPQNRVKDGAVRAALHAGMVEFALTRGASRLVGVCDTFMLPGIISLWKHKFRPIGLPQPYEEGEMIAVGFDIDEEILAMLRDRGQFGAAQMFEPPPPCPAEISPFVRERILRALHTMPQAHAEHLADWLESGESGVRPSAVKRA